MDIRNFTSVGERKEAVEKQCNVSLSAIGNNVFGETSAPERNCENMIGAVQIPLGVAGPMTIHHELFGAKNTIYVPLATTEGALVASVNRGCKAISQSGGVTVITQQVGVTRGPVFETHGLAESMTVSAWIDSHKPELAKVAEQTSSHLRLLEIFVLPVGKRVYVRFSYDTKDAMGMNMVTIATSAVATCIEKNLKIRCLSVAGNFDTDKKPSWVNILYGRGRKVWAEAHISDEILQTVLKTTAKDVFDVWLSKNMLGSVLSGSMAFNAHAANAVAALFAATGQDIAHVGEVSMCTTTIDVIKNGILVGVYLPDVIVGTVGGGTGLPTQKEALSLMGIDGGNDGKNAEKLAAIIGGVVLAGELSLLSALAEGSLSQSHERLARGKHI
jgi:hydroxymethylglutaryl-CoA reductase (NADPH)